MTFDYFNPDPNRSGFVTLNGGVQIKLSYPTTTGKWAQWVTTDWLIHGNSLEIMRLQTYQILIKQWNEKGEIELILLEVTFLLF